MEQHDDCLLQSQGLWLYVDGSINLPPLAADSANSAEQHAKLLAILDWKKNDQIVIGAITLKVHIKTDSKDMWNELKDKFESITHGTAYKWVMKLLNFRITGEESLMKEFSKLDTIMGQTMDNTMLDKLKKKLSKPKALANWISMVKPKGQNLTYTNQKGSSHRPFHQKQQPQPSTSSTPPPANTGNQQQQPFKKKKCQGQKVKACITAAQLAAAAYSSITLDNSTMDINTPMLPVPQNPPPPQQAIHSTLEIGKGGKAVIRC
ncbi:hypothetical protein FA15DRAFT_722871 [Coprinopsis marcescibilis]|uniref:Uncharacterized protein n=1 Tax=Coprinopsis marcescibilis TaxID=230819 RepID=A0A5C3KHX9_COPMA|nr:hypothetical protein FA15DRAFT_722871 [Coprinopsis marcescibilis]